MMTYKKDSQQCFITIPIASYGAKIFIAVLLILIDILHSFCSCAMNWTWKRAIMSVSSIYCDNVDMLAHH